MTSARLGVVHLVWGPLGTRPLRSFLEAYSQFPAGTAHELIVVFNGVSADGAQKSGLAARGALLGELAGVDHRLIELERPVLDLAAYFAVAKRVEHERLCFLNSYSEPLTEGWLAQLAHAANGPGVGIVAATASWASHSSHVRWLVGLGGPYSAVYEDRAETKRVFAPGDAADVNSDPNGRPTVPRSPALSDRIRAARLLVRQLLQFPAFPAPHLRTNGFLIGRELMLQIEPRRLSDKTDTYLMESGRRSFTRRVERTGLRALVVGRNGVSYGSPAWARSHTFWQGEQENLLIADNQTRSYELGSVELRRALSAHAWGSQAAPAVGTREERTHTVTGDRSAAQPS